MINLTLTQQVKANCKAIGRPADAAKTCAAHAVEICGSNFRVSKKTLQDVSAEVCRT